MTKEELLQLTDEQLLGEAKKLKSAKITNAVLIGFLIGVATYSTVKHGLGFFTFFPLFFVFILVKKGVKNTELEEILKDRNLK